MLHTHLRRNGLKNTVELSPPSPVRVFISHLTPSAEAYSYARHGFSPGETNIRQLSYGASVVKSGQTLNVSK